MIDIYTSRWADKSLAHLRCQPVGISRGNPRWKLPYRYRVARWLAPDDETWQHEDWDDFAASYRRQLDELGPDAIMGRLARISEETGGAALVLLCFEEAPQDCHRGLLLDWLRERGVEVRELGAGDLPTRSDAPQRSLFD